MIIFVSLRKSYFTIYVVKSYKNPIKLIFPKYKTIFFIDFLN